MANAYVGEIRMFGGSFAPVGWLFCEGQRLSIAAYNTLYTLIGTTYGGDGQQTFNLPDLRGRVPAGQGVGPGLAPHVIGQAAGVESVTLTTATLPVHEHAAGAYGANGNQGVPTGNVLAGSASISLYNSSEPDVELGPASVAPTGGSRPHENLQPFLCVSFIIATEGIFPPRS